jgi:hypothetical protein
VLALVALVVVVAMSVLNRDHGRRVAGRARRAGTPKEGR